MSPPLTITVVLHEREHRAAEVGYVLWPLVDVWRESGHTVHVCHGVDAFPAADVIFLHVDLTTVPAHYLQATAGHPCVINRGVADIAKTAISTMIVTTAGAGGGPVIVKTVHNHGGKPERHLEPRGLARSVRDSLARRGWLPLGYRDWLDPYAYPIFASPADVPARVYRNPALVVERFVPEREGDLYAIRSYSFLGDQSIAERTLSPHPIVKRRDAVAWEQIDTPAEIIALRHQLGFDFGKFDYIVHEGRPVLLDVNRTPAFGHSPDRLRRQGQLLAAGLRGLLHD
ncbi:MAG: hypothetical protein EXR71_10635 [Myxococcales bacterium]|nr:hypothetical protein [Myxococcales bacterium]